MKIKSKQKPKDSSVLSKYPDIRYSPVMITKTGVLKLRKSKEPKQVTK